SEQTAIGGVLWMHQIFIEPPTFCQNSFLRRASRSIWEMGAPLFGEWPAQMWRIRHPVIPRPAFCNNTLSKTCRSDESDVLVWKVEAPHRAQAAANSPRDRCNDAADGPPLAAGQGLSETYSLFRSIGIGIFLAPGTGTRPRVTGNGTLQTSPV